MSRPSAQTAPVLGSLLLINKFMTSAIVDEQCLPGLDSIHDPLKQPLNIGCVLGRHLKMLELLEVLELTISDEVHIGDVMAGLLVANVDFVAYDK